MGGLYEGCRDRWNQEPIVPCVMQKSIILFGMMPSKEGLEDRTLPSLHIRWPSPEGYPACFVCHLHGVRCLALWNAASALNAWLTEQ